MMKRFVICLFVVCLSFGLACMDSYAGEKTEKTTVNLEVTYYSNGSFFGDYEVNVYFDGELISTMRKATVLHEKIKTEKGSHSITFTKAKDESVKKSEKIVIADEKYIVYSINTTRKEIRAYRCKTDIQIIKLKGHPKCFQDKYDAIGTWGKYNHKRIAFSDGEKNIFGENIIAGVSWNDSDWIDEICIYTNSIDGVDEYVKDIDSAVSFAKEYIDLKKLAKYYDYDRSYIVNDSDSNAQKYVIRYERNSKGEKKGYSGIFVVEIEKNDDRDIESIKMLSRGTPDYYKNTKTDWSKKL